MSKVPSSISDIPEADVNALLATPTPLEQMVMGIMCGLTGADYRQVYYTLYPEAAEGVEEEGMESNIAIFDEVISGTRPKTD